MSISPQPFFCETINGRYWPRVYAGFPENGYWSAIGIPTLREKLSSSPICAIIPPARRIGFEKRTV